MKYNPAIVTAYLAGHGIPEPTYEHPFALESMGRRWRFDLCWPDCMVYLEVQGGLFCGGRHTRGAALLKEYEKVNAASVLGWRGLWCQPKDLCTSDMVEVIRAALETNNKERRAT